MKRQGTNLHDVRDLVAQATGIDPSLIGERVNLFELGVESIVIMRLVGNLRKSGINITFAELAEHPTVSDWSALLASRIPEGLDQTFGTDELVNQSSADPFDLAVLQHAYWVGRSSGQVLGGVAPHLYTEFDGEGIDPERLRAAFETLVRRHPMLRVRITDIGQQIVEPESGWRGLTVHDLRDCTSDDVTVKLETLRSELTHQLLNIEQGEVFSADLSLLPSGRTRLHLDVDMIAGDAVSYRILVENLARAYDGQLLSSTSYSYQQYLGDRPDNRSNAREEAARYWQERLDTLPHAPQLPLLDERSAPPRSTRLAFHLDTRAYQTLQQHARTYGVTPAVAVATAYAEVVGAWSNEPRFILNVPMFDRAPTHPDVDDIVGDFSSSVMLEVDLTADVSFVHRARELQNRLHADASYADYSGVEVLRDLGRRRGELILAPVVFTSALGLGELFDARVRSIFGDPVWIISQGPQVVLDAQITELDGGVLVNWDIRESEFLPGVPAAMFEAFEALVRSLIGRHETMWESPVGALVPHYQLDARKPEPDVPFLESPAPAGDRLLHRGFFTNAASNPDAVALEWSDDQSMSYGELCENALRVAAALTRRGMVVGDTVGVTLPKGPDQVIAVLGILAVGGVYVPIGVDQPASRAALIAQRAAFAVSIGDGDDAALSIADALACEPLQRPYFGDDDKPAYMIFTSGSTGEPKGVVVSHRAAMNTIDDLVRRFDLGRDYRPLCLSELDFDLCTFDLFSVFSTGGTAVLILETERRDPQRWAELISSRHVTVLSCVPPLLDMILSTGENLGTSLRVVMLGGDKVDTTLYERLIDAVPDCRFAGLGGATETAIHNSICEVAEIDPHWRAVPFGTPLQRTALRVVDRQGRDVPDWVAGELWVAGVGLADGYLGDPERTNQRFVQADGRRWYRTGDLVRYGQSSMVEFIGRVDNQIKLNGFRIELGEVESLLIANADIRSAAVVLDTAERPQLLACIVLAEDASDGAIEAVAAGLSERLPAHMVPDQFVVVTELPLTINGKIDRAAIVAKARDKGDEARASSYVAPRTHLEAAIALVWQSVLPIETVGVTDTLYSLGGDSVLATTIVAKLRDGLETRTITVRDVFSAPTVASLARQMITGEGDSGRLEAAAEIYCAIAAMSEDELLAEVGQLDVM